MKASKKKMLAGAPRTGRWTKEKPEKKRLGGPHSASIRLLIAVAVLVLAGIGVYGFFAWRALDAGLLAQYGQHVKRRDWVRLATLPPRTVNAFLAVVDTSSAPGREGVPSEEPVPGRDLVDQVYRLGDGVGDEARRVAMVPLLDQRFTRRGLLELYLNRVYLGRTGDWKVYGVYHAAEEYFGKRAEEMTLGEAATLAGLLLPPQIEDPETRPGAVGLRRNEVLRRMLEAGTIDEAAFRAAL
ncbi:MAG TPA: transglycosylase domain-containing protein, partial [Longimicrobium sp.]|nr:transglycosylase domain-containing protein [Longimicrobium sp.]